MLTTLVFLLFAAVPAPESAATATQDESTSRQAIERRLYAIAADLDGASEFRDTIRQSARILTRIEVSMQTLFLAPLSEEERAFRENLAGIQKSTSLIQYRLQNLLDDLALVAAARDKEERRWQAYHDYVCARICLEIDAAYSYNALLGQMRKEFLPAGKIVGWRLVQTRETSLAPAQSARARARIYLQQLIDQHPGSEWDALARRELQMLTLRWQWQPLSK